MDTRRAMDAPVSNDRWALRIRAIKSAIIAGVLIVFVGMMVVMSRNGARFSVTSQSRADTGSPDSGLLSGFRKGEGATAFRPTCAKARWRFAPHQELRNHLLSLSHILIRHKDNLPSTVPLSLLDWSVDLPVVHRTREEAIERAQSIRGRISGSEEFGHVAREVSEDPVTRVASGRLGLFPAAELSVWPQVLDCLAPLREGQVSDLVETEFGIHLFRIDPMPRREAFSAKRIVIGYSGAGFLKYVARRGVTLENQRTKTAALELAASILARAQREDFDALVERFSEHRDSKQNGDIGVWATWEPTIFPRLLDIIVETPVGSISAPVDSELGFQIFRRVEPTPRPRLAMRAARFAFDPDHEVSSEGSARVAWTLAKEFLEELRSPAGSIDSTFSRGGRHQLEGVEAWSRGRGPDGAEEAISRTALDELVAEPFLSDRTYIVARRVEVPEEETTLVRIGLPAPERPDETTFIQTRPISDISAILSAGREAIGPACRACADLHQGAIDRIRRSQTPTERLDAWRNLNTHIQERLSEAALEKYRDALIMAMSERLLRVRSASSRAQNARGGQ